MGLVMQSESRTVERKAVLHYLFNSDVLGYLDNPFALDLIYRTEAGRRVCNDPLKTCSGDNSERKTHERGNGRGIQTVDGQA
jgi:hypothetical protein